MRSRQLYLSSIVLFSSILFLAGCAGKTEAPKKPQKEVHSDHDGIPDHIEKKLGTDPRNMDTDLDGQSDYYELVIEPKLKVDNKPKGSSRNLFDRIFTRPAYAAGPAATTTEMAQNIISEGLTDADWDKIIKNPPDSDGDGEHNAVDATQGTEFDGSQDQDGDKIPDVYETYGYSWDYANNAPTPWGFRFTSNTSIELKSADELDYSVRYFKTNLHNAFSDWDAYDDFREASLNNIEATVLPPANHPGVASIPNFNVIVDSATVTINATQITFPSHSVLRGFKQKQSFVHVEDNPVAKYAIDLGAESVSDTAKAYSEGVINVDSKTIGSVMAKGIDLAIGPQYKQVADYESVVDVTDWLNASVDPAHQDNAASINLKWRLDNNGTDAAYDVQPTFNISLGDNLIQSYTPETKITSIGPHATSSPFATSTINLTFDQLKAYMTGSLINTRINQISANVMTRHKIDEAPSKEDWSYFTDNMRSNSATVTVDLGDGKLGTFKMLAVHPLGPSITLRDSLVWAIARYDDNGKNTSTAVGEYFGDSSSNVPDFDDWTFYFTGGVDPNDPSTPKAITPNLDNILDTVILPGATIYAKAPSAQTPVVSWAKMSPVYNAASEAAEITNMHQKKVEALVHDYFGVKTVSFGTTPDAAKTQEMTDEDGDGIYSLVLPQDYQPTRQETIFASREQLLTSNPKGEPVVTTADVSYTAATGTVYSKVVDTLTVPKKGSDYGDIAFFDLMNNKKYHKRGKLSSQGAIGFALSNGSDISVDLNFYRVNEDSLAYNDYKKPSEYPVVGWYLSSGQASGANVSFWPDDKMSYKKLSLADITSDASRVSTANASSKDKDHQQLSYTQKHYPNGSFSFRTDSGQWAKFQIGYPYSLDSRKWREWARSVNLSGEAEDEYNYYWRMQPKSVTINYTVYDK